MFKNRARIIKAMLQREAKARFGIKPINSFWVFFEPVIQVILFGGIFYFRGSQGPNGTEIFTFMLGAVITFHIFSKTSNRCMGALSANKTLLSYPILKPIDTLIARAILEYFIYTSTLIGLLFIAIAINLITNIERPHFIMLAITIAATMGFSLGVLSAALSSFFPNVTKLIPPLNRILFLTSGIFFSVNMLPHFAREIILWNPLIHLTEMARYGLFRNFPNDYFELQYPITVTYILFVLAITCLSIAERSPNSNIRGVS